MLDLATQQAMICHRISRRSLLQVGGLSVLGLNLPQWLEAESKTPAAGRKDINVILLWMGGGPSNMDTFDMKPDAPEEYRGAFQPIDTNVTGLQVCEHLPRMARSMDKVCLLRSVTHPSTVHVQASHFMLTGYQSVPPVASEDVTATVYPSYGSVVSREHGWNKKLPPYVQLGGGISYRGAGYMDSVYDPLLVKADFNAQEFRMDDLSVPKLVGDERTLRRRKMLAAVDAWQRKIDAERQKGALADRGKFYEQAYDLLTSPAAKKAFDLAAEPAKTRDRYGRNKLGQAVLLARRLVEAGARFVSVGTGRWDTHQDNFGTLRDNPECLPSLDVYWSALLEDLHERGLLDRTLVIWMGEFGRTPKVNGRGGRDHWGRSNAICLSGAGIKMGTVVGRTDKTCSEPVGPRHSTHDFAATLYHLLGIDGKKEYRGPDGRPHLINYHGKPIHEALA